MEKNKITIKINKIDEYCKKASQEEIITLFNALSKALVKQYKIKERSSLAQLNTSCASKKQHDSLYAKSFNDYRMYIAYLEDLKIIMKYIL